VRPERKKKGLCVINRAKEGEGKEASHPLWYEGGKKTILSGCKTEVLGESEQAEKMEKKENNALRQTKKGGFDDGSLARIKQYADHSQGEAGGQ